MAIRSLSASGLSNRAEALRAAVVALVAGLGLVFTVGFAHPELIHNAAHDLRHSTGFPCH